MKKEENLPPRYTESSLPARFDSWIKQVLDGLIYNEVRSYMRQMRRLPEIATEDIDDIAVSDPPMEEEFVEIIIGSTPLMLSNKKLAKALGQISERKQQVLEATIVLGIPAHTVAKALGLDEQVVYNYKSLGLKELRRLMEDGNEESEEG